MDNSTAKQFILKLIKDVYRPESGPVQLTRLEITVLHEVYTEVVRLLVVGDIRRIGALG